MAEGMRQEYEAAAKGTGSGKSGRLRAQRPAQQQKGGGQQRVAALLLRNRVPAPRLNSCSEILGKLSGLRGFCVQSRVGSGFSVNW